MSLQIEGKSRLPVVQLV